MLFQFLIFPPVARYYGVLPCLRAVTLAYPIIYLLTPFAVLFPTPMAQQVAILVSMLAKAFAGVFAFPCTTIMLTNSATSLRLLGTLNGVATSISAIGRAIGPAIAGSTFTLGIDLGYVVLAWWILSAFAVLGHLPTWWLVEMEGFGHTEADTPDSDDADANDGMSHAHDDAAQVRLHRVPRHHHTDMREIGGG